MLPERVPFSFSSSQTLAMRSATGGTAAQAVRRINRYGHPSVTSVRIRKSATTAGAARAAGRRGSAAPTSAASASGKKTLAADAPRTDSGIEDTSRLGRSQRSVLVTSAASLPSAAVS